MIAFPFTKLMHAVTFAVSRYYNGSIQGRKGAEVMTATLERGLNALREQIDAPVASFFTSCVSCGLCAEACLFYKETGDPQYTPIHKLEPMRRLWKNEFTLLGRAKAMLGLGEKIDRRDADRMGNPGLRQLHHVRPLHPGLPGRQRHHHDDPQDARRHVGLGPRPGRA